MEAEKEVTDRGDKKKQLFLNQKQLLDTFLEHGAISREQYDKSLGDLIVKMGITIAEQSENYSDCPFCKNH